MAKKPPGKKTVKPDDLKPDDDDDRAGDEGDGEDEGDDDRLDAKAINGIVTSRIKRALKPFEETLTKLSQSLETLVASKSGGGDGGEGDDEDDDQATTKSKVDPAMKKKLDRLEKQLRDQTERTKKAEEEAKAQKERVARDEEQQVYMSALQKAGITDSKLARAAFLALREDGVITRDESGKVKFKTTDQYGGDELLDPDRAIAKWVKDEGKSYVPAVNAGGSGQGGAHNAGTGTAMTKAEFNKLDKYQRARIEIERASQGLPPLE